MIDEIFGALRGLANIGVVQSSDDSGEVQTVTVLTADGATRADVEVMQIYGFASLAPENGSICLLLAVGGDPANLRALPVATPAARFGGMSNGDACMYVQDGSRIHIKQAGVIEIWAGSSMTINAAEVSISGALSVKGDVVAGSGSNNTSLLKHTHSDPQGENTGPPTG